MQAVYRVNEHELDEQFLAALKTLFAGKQIQIVVTEQVDDASALFRSSANSRKLLEAIDYLDDDEELITVDTEQYPLAASPLSDTD